MKTSVFRSFPAYQLYRLFWDAVDWLYPPVCAGCGKPGIRFCTECSVDQKPFYIQSVCQICGDQCLDTLCDRCSQNFPAFDQLRSWGHYNGALRKALISLKYDRNFGVAADLSRFLIKMIKTLNIKPDLIVPVPLNEYRYIERGYNQASLLARPAALSLGVEYKDNVLIRTRNTNSQVGLNIQERAANVKNAFTACSEMVRDRVILLIDDIATTGSTLSACAEALKNFGAGKVYCLTIARSIVQ